MSADDLPGFAGLLQLGHTPEQAWQIIRDATVAEPGARPVLLALASSPEGLAALQWSRERWAEHGLEPPWAELLEGNQ